MIDDDKLTDGEHEALGAMLHRGICEARSPQEIVVTEEMILAGLKAEDNCLVGDSRMTAIYLAMRGAQEDFDEIEDEATAESEVATKSKWAQAWIGLMLAAGAGSIAIGVGSLWGSAGISILSGTVLVLMALADM